MPDVQSYRAEWFISGGTVRSNVTLRIVDGHVVEIAEGYKAGTVDLGAVALVDGLVNAHTHLEFSRLEEPIPTTGRFTDWIRSVVRYRNQNPENTTAAIAAGFRESLRAGTTLVGDIATVGWAASDYDSSELPSVVFQELLGLSPQRVHQQRELAGAHAASQGTRWNAALSSHAPYSTHLDLVSEAVEQASTRGFPVAMHLAETTSELELLSSGTGEFREMLTDFGIWNDELFRTPRTPMDYLQKLAKAPRALVVHGNYLNEEELRFIAANPQMTLVYCPRTHAAFRHREHPWRRLVDMGGHVAIGTDSRASNPDLSLFAELQFLAARNPDLSHLDLLAHGSVEGRRALKGMSRSDLLPAHFTLIRMKQRTSDPRQDLFGPESQVCGTMVDGQWLWKEFN